ncbi:hypothetical protein [Microbacterium sp. MM2322]|uniref:hypothetical protein n=1 Tax=Microbacterium sp. MM2322 TaxID=3157631 RepID=UPI0032D5A903
MADLVREDDLDDESYQIREVLAQYGAAMYQAQVLESGLINVLAIAEGNGIPNATVRDFDAVIDAASRKTMGALLRKLQPHLGSDTELVEDLQAGLRLRNRLAHSFFGEYSVGFTRPEGRESMLVELHIAIERFEGLDRRLDPVLGRYLDARGIDEAGRSELLAAAQTELIRRYEEEERGQ